MNDLVSIIIPVYKVENYLDECLDSVVKQSYTNLEIILVDDGSPDSSPQICDEWAKKDSRIKVIHKTNEGVSLARNAALDIAQGDYFACVDSDDIVEPLYIEKMYDALQQHPDCGIAACSAVIFDGSEKKSIYNEKWYSSEIRFIEPEEYADRILTMERAHTVWGKLFRKTVLGNVRFRSVFANEELFLALDLYPTIEREKIRLVEIPDKLYCYRVNPNSIVHSAGYRFALTETACRERLLQEVEEKKPYVYQYYQKMLLLDYLSTIHLKLSFNPKEIRYYEYCRKLRRYTDTYAKKNVSRKEFFFFLSLKYLPTLSFCIFRLKNLLTRHSNNNR